MYSRILVTKDFRTTYKASNKSKIRPVYQIDILVKKY